MICKTITYQILTIKICSHVFIWHIMFDQCAGKYFMPATEVQPQIVLQIRRVTYVLELLTLRQHFITTGLSCVRVKVRIK